MSEQDLLGAFDAPVVEVIGGSEQTLPLFDLDGLAELGAAIIGRKKQKALAKVLGEDHDRVRNIVDFYAAQEATIDDMIRYAGTPRGALDVLSRSMVNAGVPKELAQRKAMTLARQRGFAYASGVALRVATLFGQPDPNAPAPAESEEGDTAGEPSDSSSST